MIMYVAKLLPRCVPAPFTSRELLAWRIGGRGRGFPAITFSKPSTPFGADLDIFGPASLFELLCTARTRKGQETLAGWLKGPAEPKVIRERQRAVEELRNKLDLRERLAVLGGDMPAGADLDSLVGWGEAPLILHRPGLRLLATFLVTCTIVATIAFLVVVMAPPRFCCWRWAS